MAAPHPAIRLSEVTVRHGTSVALERLSLVVEAGTFVAVIGPNGSGKSTLLRTLAGLQPPTTGRVEVDGEIAMVLQTTTVDESLPITVRDTVRMARYARRGPFHRLRPVDHAVVDGALQRMDVAELADRQLHELSGGQRQRVLVAQGLAQEADVLLLDEPVAGLDPGSRDRILDAIEEEHRGGTTVLMSTHDLDEARRCDVVVLLATGLVAVGPPSAVLVEANLNEAFGGRVLRLAGGELFVDDPHLTPGHGATD